ncbi:hypothetical protein GCM10017673_37870 [Streptosporangium violaceochromogenes]|nr:hypothetical protein GCM10017673_37870 [Streptosporangium violaceochromogenes]
MALNLNAARRARAERRGRKAGPFPLYFGANGDGSDKLIAMLPPGLPLHALEPFTRLDVDLSYLLHVVEKAMLSGNNTTNAEVIGMATGLLHKTPNLPAQLVNAVREAAVEILGKDGYDRFMAERPDVEDIGELVRSLAAEWSVGRGESSPPSGGSPSGTEDSTPISNSSTDSTSPESSTTPKTPDSSPSTPSSTSATSFPTTPE